MNDAMRNDPLPVEWNEWRALWDEWLQEQRDAGRLTPTSYRHPGQNLLADEVLGTWSTGARIVELSELTFPALGDLGGRTVRYVGVTYPTAAGTDGGTVVSSFAELEAELGFREPLSVNRAVGETEGQG